MSTISHSLGWLESKSPLLGMYPPKMKTVIQKDICIPMFTEALFFPRYGTT